jgi:hypothetical protein
MRLLAIVVTLLATAGCTALSRARRPVPLTAGERETAATLRRHVEAIASVPHNMAHCAGPERAASYITEQFWAAGYTLVRQPHHVGSREVANIEVERRGTSRPDQIIVIGAHYDSAGNAPGANDNGSGVAALLELARAYATGASAAASCGS